MAQVTNLRSEWEAIYQALVSSGEDTGGNQEWYLFFAKIINKLNSVIKEHDVLRIQSKRISSFRTKKEALLMKYANRDASNSIRSVGHSVDVSNPAYFSEIERLNSEYESDLEDSVKKADALAVLLEESLTIDAPKIKWSDIPSSFSPIKRAVLWSLIIDETNKEIGVI